MHSLVKKVIKREGIKNPVLSYRIVGNRVELHLLGTKEYKAYSIGNDAPDPEIVLPPVERYTSADLSEKTVKELHFICKAKGLPTSGRRKINLISSILEYQERFE